MEVGIREAKNNLSKLVDAVLEGHEVILTNRGERVAQLVPVAKRSSPGLGRGMWEGKVHLYPGWDSPEEDKKIEDMFEALSVSDSEWESCSTPTSSCDGWLAAPSLGLLNAC